jgi:hypothetical protein
MDWIPEPSVALKFILFFGLGFETHRYVQAIRNKQVEVGELGRRFIGLTSWLHAFLMVLVFLLHWYDFGFIKTIVLFVGTMLVVAPILSGVVLARTELYFGDAWWGIASVLLYPAAIWLLLSFSWFGALDATIKPAPQPEVQLKRPQPDRPEWQLDFWQRNCQKTRRDISVEKPVSEDRVAGAERTRTGAHQPTPRRYL